MTPGNDSIRTHRRGRLLSRLLLVGCCVLWSIAGSAGTTADDGRHDRPDHRAHADHFHPRPAYPNDYPHAYGGADALPGIAPDIGVLIAPETEHWPGNYQPDGYRLDGYDGRPRGPSSCQGRGGHSWSTQGSACPAGQKPDTRGRQLSTGG